MGQNNIEKNENMELQLNDGQRSINTDSVLRNRTQRNQHPTVLMFQNAL